MTQPPADILPRIEQLLYAGKLQEAQLLLVDYIKTNPTSAHAWWLMSLTLKDIDQQMDCLKRVLLLEPGNKSASERLSQLVNLPPAPVPASPITPGTRAVTSEPAGKVPTSSAAAVSPEVKAEPIPAGPAKQQGPPSPIPPAPGEPGKKAPPPQKPRPKHPIVYILIFIFAIAAVILIGVYLSKLRKEQAAANILHQTEAVAQTLTNLPLPTLIPTWTASPSFTALPTTTHTETPTFTPTIELTSTKTPRPPSLVGPEVDKYAPDFSLTNLATGQRETLSKYDGHPVLLFFWATWCTPCVNETGSIETITQTYKEAGLVVLTIDAGEDYATLTIFRNSHKVTFPILLDPGTAVMSVYQVNKNSLPRHFFINSSGKIAFIGDGEMTPSELKLQVDAIMKPPPTPTP